jgi:hypothetical protein
LLQFHDALNAARKRLRDNDGTNELIIAVLTEQRFPAWARQALAGMAGRYSGSYLDRYGG